MIEKTISHYQILDKIGEGGMGVVYKAEDTKLKRTVALKFLPPELTKDPQAKARFLQEAQAAAALDHPNICAVFEIGEAENTTYIAMPYVRGQSLKEKIAAGPLSVEEALDIAGQVGEGLKEAHEKGIIHRDIKPANIMLTEKGQAKIMDFGLAKLAWAADLTKTAGTMGTLAYMSPEQARGDAVDHRTDIWSLGVVLYEMLAGQLPFRGEETQGVVYSILNKDPEPLSVLRPDIPRPVVQVVVKALEKDHSRRYQNIQEFAKDLKAPAPFIFPKPEKSIVVLPFEDLSPGKDNEYFSDGLTEEIIADLSQVHDLLVISRSSAMTFKGTKKTIPEIARAVNVRYVLEGSVRKAGNNLRITAQLIDATNDAHLWAEKYSGILDDIFDIQEKVSRSIVDALRLKLTPEEKKKIAASSIPNVYAYECYLKARHELWKWTEEGLNNALIHLQKGLDLVGENAVLLAGMGYSYFQYFNTGTRVDELTIQKAEEYTNRALELDPESPNAYIVLGLLLTWRGKLKESIGYFKRALAFEPNNFDALVWLPSIYSFLGKTDAALPFAEWLLKIEPMNPMAHHTLGLVHIMGGKFDVALDLLRQAHKAYPRDHLIRWIYAQTLAYCHLVDEAFSVIDELAKETPDDLLAKLGFSLALASQHNKSDTLLILQNPKMEVWARNDCGYSFFISECYALLDEKDKALDWLENSVNRGMINYPMLSEYDPFLANIRGEPRFQKLMERVKYEWEHFEV
jgi:non-specific serine/threonine protein kinase